MKQDKKEITKKDIIDKIDEMIKRQNNENNR